MKRTLTGLSALLACVGALSAAAPRPINDGASNTLLLAEREGSYSSQGGSTATAELGETPVGGAAAAHTVWYRYTAPVNGRFVVDLEDDQGLRAELRLPGNPAPTIPLQTFADGTSNTIAFGEERLSADLTRGQTIYLVVDAASPFDFSWRFIEAINDFYKDAETLLGPSGTVKRSDRGATLSPYESGLGLAQPAVWYQWTATSTGSFFVDLVGSRRTKTSDFSNFSLQVYTSQNGVPGTLLGAASGSALDVSTRVNFGATAGLVYYFACHGGQAVPNNELWLSWYPAGSAGVLDWAQPEYRAGEPDGAVTVRAFKLRGNGSGSVGITATPSGNSPATAGSDYTVPPGSTFLGPDARTATFVLPFIEDTLEEPVETVSLGFSGSFGIQDGTSNTISITDVERSGACGFANSVHRVREGETARVEVRRLRAGTRQIVVGWQAVANDGAAIGIDLPGAYGTATIDAGELSTFIEVPTYQDGSFEGAESFSLELSDSPLVGSIVDGTSNTIVLIEDDDYFVPRGGRYCGVVDTDGWGALVNCMVSSGGTATGAVEYQGVKYPFRGAFDAEGQLAVPLQRGNRPPLGLRLAFSEGWNACDIAVRDPEGTWADGVARLLPYDGKQVVAPQAGAYTFVCAGQGGVEIPFVITGAVKANGSARCVGKMADGTPVAFGGGIALGDGSVRGVVAFATPLYGRAGNFYGTVELGLGPQQPGGESRQWWLKPWRPADAIYPALPFQTSLCSAIRYTPPAAGQWITGPIGTALGDGSVRFINGSTTLDNSNNLIQIGLDNKVTFPTNPNACSIKIDPKSGVFSGRITPPGAAPTTFYGAFHQGNYGYGIGFYLGAGKAGRVEIEAAP